jgi:hypothetical protein
VSLFEPRIADRVDATKEPELAHPFFARLLLSSLAATQGLAPLRIDLRPTHATNPLWTRHARFHIVWQVLIMALLAPIEVALIWLSGPAPAERFYLAASLTAMPLLAFWGALASIRLYGGALFDQNGILPWKIHPGGKSLQLDMNTVVVALASILLLITVAIY